MLRRVRWLAALLLALPALSCATHRSTEGEGHPERPTSSPLLAGDIDCPYLRVYVTWQVGADFDAGLQSWAAHTYSALLDAQGFEIVDDPEAAYWSVTTTAMRSAQNRRVMIWHTSFRERPRVVGRRIVIGPHMTIPVTATAQADMEDLREFNNFGEIFLRDFAATAAYIAEQNARLFGRRALRYCTDLPFALREEEGRLERLREELSEEIHRVREGRRRATQRKRLELEVQPEHRKQLELEVTGEAVIAPGAR